MLATGEGRQDFILKKIKKVKKKYNMIKETDKNNIGQKRTPHTPGSAIG